MKKIKNHSYTILAILSKLINSFFILKILAIILSSKELVNYLLFLNNTSIFQFIFTLGLTTGIIAEAKSNKIYRDYITILLIATFLFLLLLLLSSFCSILEPIVIITSLFISLKLISFSMLNGLNRKKEFTIYCFLDSIILITLVYCFNTQEISNSYIYAYLITSVIILALFLLLINKELINSIMGLNLFSDLIQFISRYKNYFYMSFFSAFIVPSINLFIRDYISSSKHSEFNIATLLSGWRLNESLLMVVGTISSIYFIQKFTSIDGRTKQLKLIIKNSIYFSLITLILPLSVYLLPDLIITILLSNQYSENYFIFTIIFISFSLRAFTYISGLYLVIHKKVFPFIIIELSHTIFLAIYIYYSINSSALIMSIGFLLQSVLALIATSFFLYREK
ncbi:hypothetical protein [Proteus mirabilis]|uniref:hypothetical protein n=1 Tax=Proteus mirabilis TaxID=584 RepID=UPI0013D271C9|nr:hypothetical protein [Proteus mirabilis]